MRSAYHLSHIRRCPLLPHKRSKKAVLSKYLVTELFEILLLIVIYANEHYAVF